MRALRDAAARGVRVRLLIDDLYTGGQDELLACLAAHERVEVRLFNPFALRSGGVFARFAASPFFFGRLNHRMHNKLFVADAAWAITGGRNIGDEYFTRNDAGNFIDLDVLAAGEVVGDMSLQFDLYWNSAATVPIEYVAARSAPAHALRDRFETLTQSASAPALVGADAPDALGRSSVAKEFAAGRVHLAWGDGESYADLPGKALSASQTQGRQEHGSNLVRLNALEHIRAASREILLTSPYFIPGRAGVDLLAEAARRGVKVSVLTNSLASTDQPLVHGAYRRYRPALLAAGVALFELSPQRAGREEQRKLFGLSVGGLHTKSLVIDRKELFVGSMNFDPRSDRINTESALAIHVAEVAEDAARLAALSKMQAAHQLRLSEGQALEWISPAGGEGPIHPDEPESEFWQKSGCCSPANSHRKAGCNALNGRQCADARKARLSRDPRRRIRLRPTALALRTPGRRESAPGAQSTTTARSCTPSTVLRSFALRQRFSPGVVRVPLGLSSMVMFWATGGSKPCSSSLNADGICSAVLK
jgi:putative cardiolipin synthase